MLKKIFLNRIHLFNLKTNTFARINSTRISKSVISDNKNIEEVSEYYSNDKDVKDNYLNKQNQDEIKAKQLKEFKKYFCFYLIFNKK